MQEVLVSFLFHHGMANSTRTSLNIGSICARWAQGDSPTRFLKELMERVEAYPGKGIWIHRLSTAQVMEQLAESEERHRSGPPLPLFGVPFAVKDNVDFAGCPTSAACPQFTYVPTRSATVVDRLRAAGAIIIGKTNLDQFALGLSGTRSPYGACENAFDRRFISGGSSSGSAVAVAAGLVSFALATDTAGSGRVPAGFNNIVGLKPTRGRLSTAGVVPACRSLDCVSIMALSCPDAARVAEIAAGYDPLDAYSRRDQEIPPARPMPIGELRLGIPAARQLQFFGNAAVEKQYRRAVEQLKSLGATAVEIDFEPFLAVARLLYHGPWVAERLTSTERLLADSPESIFPVTRSVLSAAQKISGAETFEGIHTLQKLRRQVELEWNKMDVLLVPTAPTIYTIAQVEADPMHTNANLGYYTNFVNLLDLCALAAPAGFGADGLPIGVTLIAPAGQESALLDIGQRFHAAQQLPLGATGCPMPADEPVRQAAAPAGVRLAVVGAHLSGQPLNWQLKNRNARLIGAFRTVPSYRLYALPDTKPAKPGMIQCGNGGASIELEVWEMSPEAFGSFVAAIPPPLGIGTITLENGERVKGFLCEEIAVRGAHDISSFGGWLAFLATQERIAI